MNYYIFAFLAAFLFGVAPVFSKIGLEGVNPGVALTIRSSVITCVMLFWVMLMGGPDMLSEVTPRGWFFLALDGISAALLGQLFYYYALKSGEASIVVPLVASFPVFTSIIAFFFLGERLTAMKASGLVLVVLGVILLRV